MAHYDRHGSVAPDDFLTTLRPFDAIFLGAVGWPARLPDHVTLAPLIRLRQAFDLYACVRPARTFPGVPHPLRSDEPIDLVVIRENSEGEYVNNGGVLAEGTPDEVAVQSAVHTRRGVERILRFAFELAQTRRRRLTMITKSNAQRFAYVLWDRVLEEMKEHFADVTTEKLHIDAATLELVRRPHTFDVVVGSNLFGDILSDLTGGITGSLGLNPSANLDPQRRWPSLFEPVHGSAPDIAGKGIANPDWRDLERRDDARMARRGARRSSGPRRRRACAGRSEPDTRSWRNADDRRVDRPDRGAARIVTRDGRRMVWRVAVPLLAGAAIAMAPVPQGLPPHAWRYFAAFVAVILSLITEPLPAPALGLIAVTVMAVFGLPFSQGQLADPAFRLPAESLKWALAGFANGTVWLIFSAFVVAMGYERTRLGRRIALFLVKHLGRKTLGLGYAITLADLALAPFTPSNSARSAGTIFPIIRNIPELYGSRPGESPRAIGAYLMWVAFSTTCVTSSMFVTALAPNLLALEMVKTATGIQITWTEWLVGFLPVGALLLVLLPYVTYKLYPPTVRTSVEVPQWATAELDRMGRMSVHETIMALLVVGALTLWIFGGSAIDPTMVALAAISLMLATGVVAWDDIVGHKAAWNVLVWFATLVTLADGLGKVGFVGWFGARPRRCSPGTRRRPSWSRSSCCSFSCTTCSRASRRTRPRCCRRCWPPAWPCPGCRSGHSPCCSATRSASWASSRRTRPVLRRSTSPAASSRAGTSGGWA